MICHVRAALLHLVAGGAALVALDLDQAVAHQRYRSRRAGR